MNEPERSTADDAVERVLRSAESRAGVARFGAAEASAIQKDWSDAAGADTADGEQYDREERAALRRVSGLSTELEDVTEVEYRQLRLENVVLIGVYSQGSQEDAENSLRELAALAETAGARVLDGLLQRRPHPDPSTYLGSGKAEELRHIVAALANARIEHHEIRPRDAGLETATLAQLKGGSASENAAAINKLLGGERGAFRDIVLLNASAALIIADKAKNLRDGAALAAEAVDSGKAKATLANLAACSRAA